MAKHRIKIWPEYFEAVEDGRKTFEHRVDDRNYKVGDILILEEWDPHTPEMPYTGRELVVAVTYAHELPNNQIIMSIKKGG
jgi:ASC-1-like (ASCH) protein